MALLRPLALLLAALAGSSALVEHKQKGKPTGAGRDVCEHGLWSEATVEELLTGAREPDVQCAREPPCVRWSWTTFERCKTLPDDEDWPTWDPHLPAGGGEGLHSWEELVSMHLLNKTGARGCERSAAAAAHARRASRLPGRLDQQPGERGVRVRGCQGGRARGGGLGVRAAGPEPGLAGGGRRALGAAAAPGGAAPV